MSFGADVAIRLNNFHKLNTGVSRYEKFSYLINEILPILRPEIVCDKVKLRESLLTKFSLIVVDKLLKCELTSGLNELRTAIPNARWLIVSGGDQAELRQVFEQRGIADYFDGGIYGSPRSKFTILSDLLETGVIKDSVLSLGDSRLDHEVAIEFDFDFVFVSKWTEFIGWRKYCEKHQIQSIKSISDLLNSSVIK